MRPTAEFSAQRSVIACILTKQGGWRGNRDDAGKVTIFLVKQGQCPNLDGVGGGHLHNRDRQVCPDGQVYPFLNGATFIWRE